METKKIIEEGEWEAQTLKDLNFPQKNGKEVGRKRQWKCFLWFHFAKGILNGLESDLEEIWYIT